MKDQKRAYIYALCSVGIWSTVATAFKLSLRYTHVVNLLTIASLVSLLIFFIASLISGQIRQITELNRKDIAYSGILGILNPFLYYLILFSAYNLLRAQEAQAINYTWAIILSLFSVFFLGQRLTLWDIIGLVLGYFGVFLIITKGDITNFAPGTNLTGVGLALLSTIIWAAYWILNTRDTLNPLLRLMLNFGWGSAALLPLFWINLQIHPLNLYGLLGGIYIGLFEMGITYLLWSRALKFAESTARISILIYLSPFVSLVFIHYILGERIYLSTIIALLLIIGGIVLQQIKLKKDT